MDEDCLWRQALAQQIAVHYSADPKVMTVIVGGSVARGCADRFSDIDLAVFWTESPTAKARRAIIKLTGGERVSLFKEMGVCGKSISRWKGSPSMYGT